MIRLARWEHASPAHHALFAALTALILFSAFIGALHLARCAWRRRRKWISTLRRALWDGPQGPRHP